jgi:hypothetical protein
MTEALGRINTLSSGRILADFIQWKEDPIRRQGGITFLDATDQVESYERSQAEMENLLPATFDILGPQTATARNKEKPVTRPTSIATAIPNPNTGPRKPDPKSALERWGPVCKFPSCKTRSFDLDTHMKTCRRNPANTASNMVKVINLNVNLAAVKVINSKDYLPLLPLLVSPSEDAKSSLEIEVFVDSGSQKLLIRGSFADLLVKQHHFVETEEQTYRVNGVDASGKGVLCHRHLVMHFHAGDSILAMKALIVPGLPEDVIGGRDWKRALNLTISSGEKEEENFIHSKLYNISHPLMTERKYRKAIQSVTDSFVCTVEKEDFTTARTKNMKSMFSSLSKQDMEEIFRLWTPPTSEQ